jgi:hypothetical protein
MPSGLKDDASVGAQPTAGTVRKRLVTKHAARNDNMLFTVPPANKIEGVIEVKGETHIFALTLCQQQAGTLLVRSLVLVQEAALALI